MSVFFLKIRLLTIAKIAIVFSLALVLLLKYYDKPVYMPKPYGHIRILLPDQLYVPLNGDYPYKFEISKYASIIEESKKKFGPFCITIKYNCFDAVIQITYKACKANKEKLRSIIKASKALTQSHQVKAHDIVQSVAKTKKGLPVVVYELYGEIPTPIQFYTTDGAKHFLRGAVYLKKATENDYLEPIISFIKRDILHLIDTLEFNDGL